MATKKVKTPLYKSLTFQVVAAIVIGALVGHYYPDFGADMKPLGDMFIKLIKMVIAPIIFCTIVTGIASMESMKEVGRVGLKSLLYFEVMTTLALILGLLIANVVQPGVGMNIDISTLDKKALDAYSMGAKQHDGGVMDFILGMIPNTFSGAFTGGDLLQVLLVSILFAWAALSLGEKGRSVIKIIDDMSHVFFHIVGIIMKIAPIGAFGAMAFSIGKFGLGSMVNLLYFVLLFYGSCVLFVFFLGVVMRMYTGLKLWDFLKYIHDELLIVFGTSSSETVMPRIIDKLTHAGCSKPVVGLVVPTGYSFNLDGTSLYFTLAAIFLAQATNTEMGMWEQLTLLAVLLLTSKGAAGVYGSAFVILTGTLTTVGHIPPVSVVLILGIDRFMSTGRALTNLIGYGVATFIIAKWENQLNAKRAADVMSGKRDAGIESA